jgi:hypothetical protein
VFKNKSVSLLVPFIVLGIAQFAIAKIEPIIGSDRSMTYIFDQNREAQIFKSHADPTSLKINFEVSENLCVQSYKKPKCYYQVGVSQDHLSLLWTKHTDPSKIGKIVKIVKSKKFDLEFVPSTFANKFMQSSTDSRFQPDEIVCDDYGWLGVDLNTSKKIRISSWHSEKMSTNSQTGLKENRTSLSAENVEFVFENNKLVLNNIGKITFANLFGILALLPGGTSTTFRIDQGPGSYCQISLSQNLASAAAGIDFDAAYKINPNYILFKYPHSFYQLQFNNQFNNVFDSTDSQKVDFE